MNEWNVLDYKPCSIQSIFHHNHEKTRRIILVLHLSQQVGSQMFVFHHDHEHMGDFRYKAVSMNGTYPYWYVGKCLWESLL